MLPAGDSGMEWTLRLVGTGTAKWHAWHLLHRHSDAGRGKAALPPLLDEDRLIAKYACWPIVIHRLKVLWKDVPVDQILRDTDVTPLQPGCAGGKPGRRGLIV